MFFLYIDESGSNTSHFVLLGYSIPAVTTWRDKTEQMSTIKSDYDLDGKEIHTAWMLKKYIEQKYIPDFEKLDYAARRKAVEKKQDESLIKIAARGNAAKIRSKKTEIKKVRTYIHLTHNQRIECIKRLLSLINSWTDARIFGEAVYKAHYDLSYDIYENAFTQVVSRFDNFLRKISKPEGADYHGLIIQDSNKDMAHRLTNLMRKFHNTGTIWNRFTRIIETPLFVDSELTGMIQVADICAYATRRFFENGETDFFNFIYDRFDRLPKGTLVGLRHYTGKISCSCKVCIDHNK